MIDCDFFFLLYHILYIGYNPAYLCSVKSCDSFKLSNPCNFCSTNLQFQRSFLYYTPENCIEKKSDYMDNCNPNPVPQYCCYPLSFPYLQFSTLAVRNLAPFSKAYSLICKNFEHENLVSLMLVPLQK